MKINYKQLQNHETKNYSLNRFFIVLAILTVYILFLIYKFGNDGFSLGLITWSAFLLATPIADAGILFDLPIRIFFGFRMIYSELIVWAIDISANLFYLHCYPDVYHKTLITDTFYQILTKPWPNWIVIFLSAAGTFLSLYFGDELLDIVFFHQRKKYQKHRNYWYVILIIFSIVGFYLLYKYFLSWFRLKI